MVLPSGVAYKESRKLFDWMEETTSDSTFHLGYSIFDGIYKNFLYINNKNKFFTNNKK